MGSPAAAASSGFGSGSGSGSSASGERLKFSSVARLGFAAAHDSPALKTEEISIDQPHNSTAIGNLTTILLSREYRLKRLNYKL